MATEFPTTWTDTRQGNWTRDGEAIGASVSAAPDLTKWDAGYDVPGIFLGVSTTLASDPVEKLLDDAEGGLFEGLHLRVAPGLRRVWLRRQVRHLPRVRRDRNDFFIVVVKPADGSYVVFAEVVVLADRDLFAVDHAIEVLKVLDAP